MEVSSDMNKKFVFFVENEMKIIPNDQNKYYSTINAVLMNKNGKVQIFKIDAQFTVDGLESDQNVLYFPRAKEYVVENFPDAQFLGCVRDNNVTHNLVTTEKFAQRDYDLTCFSDPYHDIFNSTKKILIGNNNLKYTNGNENTMLRWSDIVAENDFLNDFRSADYPGLLETHARVIVQNYFMHNRFERIIHQSHNGRRVLEFLALLKEILELMEKRFNAKILNSFKICYEKLNRYNWDISYDQDSLIWLKRSMQFWIEFYETYEIQFKAKYFSTQLIEAEKGYLRTYDMIQNEPRQNSINPPKNDCEFWTNRAIAGDVDVEGTSGFGTVHIVFSPLEGAEGARLHFTPFN